ncbi:MAG: hypothetical protein ABID45_03245 [Patescibacteria group bacterium]
MVDESRPSQERYQLVTHKFGTAFLDDSYGFKEASLEDFMKDEQYGGLFIEKYLQRLVEMINRSNRERGKKEINFDEFIQGCIKDNFTVYIREKEVEEDS